jgi:hypothetical protein
VKSPRRLQRMRVLVAAGTTVLAAASLVAGSACDGLIGLDPPIEMRDATPPSPDTSDDAPGPTLDAQEAAAGPGDAAVDTLSCALTVCDGGCADLTSDGQNCGACGHSCFGGTCDAGRCLPEVLAVGNPVSFAVDATNLYWADGRYGTILSCPLDGCPDAGPQTLYAGVGGYSPFVGGIAVQGGRVLFIEQNTSNSSSPANLYSCPSTGCEASPAVEATQTGMAVVADSNDVYWAAPAGVLDCPVAGCATGGGPTTLVSIGSGEVAPSPWDLAVGGGFVYFTNFGGGVGSCGLSSGGCSCPPFAGGCMLGSLSEIPDTPPTALALGASSVYWTLASANDVVAVPFAPPDAGVPSAGLFATVESPGDIAVDSENVYFTTTQGSGAIYKCAVGGCNQTPTVFASGLGGLGAIAVDAKRVYVIVGTQNDGITGPSMGNAIVWIAK